MALGILVAVVAVEEMPAGSRAYAISLLAMATALGAGACVVALPLADLGIRGWRLVYVVPLLGLVLVPGVSRRLVESRRYEAPHADAGFSGHAGRFWLLAGSGMLLNLFVAPASAFQNRYLKNERGYSASRISLLTLVTNTPGGIGIIAGGRLADMRGRRIVGSVALFGGTLCTVWFFFASGWTLWVASTIGAIVGAAAVPALGVYSAELLPDVAARPGQRGDHRARARRQWRRPDRGGCDVGSVGSLRARDGVAGRRPADRVHARAVALSRDRAPRARGHQPRGCGGVLSPT